MKIEKRAKRVKLLVLDVDGVLTDGRLLYSGRGDELKAFDVSDGMGLALWSSAGMKSAVLTAKSSKVIARRCRDINIDKVYQNARDKHNVFKKILADFGLNAQEVCFMGDDVVDIPVLRKAGLAVSVPNAAAEAKRIAHHITRHEGGRGAVREMIEMILKLQGRWDAIIKKYYL